MSMTADWDETEFEAIFREHFQACGSAFGTEPLKP
jgi:hypothetical protein